MRPDGTVPHAPAILRLLQGVVYSDERTTWNLLLTHQLIVRQEFARIGLELVLSEPDGYAFLRQPDREEGEDSAIPLPRLTRRDRLSFGVTLLCVLLRERLDQFEVSAPESDRLVLSLEELRELQRPFYPERTDERMLHRQLDGMVSKVVALGFLQGAGGDARYEVRRVLKARLDVERLEEIKAKLVEAALGKGSTGEEETE